MKTKIKEIREEKGLSTRDLAKIMDTTQATVSRLENGQREMTLKWLARFAVALNTDPKNLF